MIKKINISKEDEEELRKIMIDPNTQIDDYFDYSKVVVKKPWGYEYLIYQNGIVAVWILYIKKGFQTSMHCHPNKKTSLIVLSGEAECSTLNESIIRSAGQCMFIPKAVFHSTKSLSDEGIFVMEIETPINKRDLIRLKDNYGREGKGYETIDSMSFNIQNYNYISLIDPHIYYNVKKKFGKCSISLTRFGNIEEFDKNFNYTGWDTISILKGKIIDQNNRIIAETGDIIEINQIKNYHNIRIDEELELIYIKRIDNMTKVSDFVIACLEKNNINDIFIVPGSANVHLIDSIGRNTNIRHITTQTEHAATMAAEAYAKLTNNIGVSIVSSGISSINALTGIADSWIDSAPLLIISGQSEMNKNKKNQELRQLGIQELDIINMVKPITKYAVRIDNPNDIKYYMLKAMHIATTGRPGPVWIEMPIDLQGKAIDEDDLIEFTIENEDLIRDEFDTKQELNRKTLEVIKLLKTAERPVILAGNGIRISNAENEFSQLINKLKIPVLTSRRGCDIIEGSNKFFFGRPGAYGQRAANFIIQNSDLLICIGSRLSIPLVGRNYHSFAREAKKIVVDVDKSELEKCTVKIDLPIQSSAKEFIRLLLKNLEISEDITNNITSSDNTKIKKWFDKCAYWKLKFSRTFEESMCKKTEAEINERINPYKFIEALSDILQDGDIITMDSGSIIICTMQTFNFKNDQRLITSTGLENRNFSLSAAIGACIGSKGKRIICVCEDRGFLKSLQELETVVGYNLPIKIFVLNYKGYSFERMTQKEYFGGRYVASDSSEGKDNGKCNVPDLIKIGECYNLPTLKIKSQDDMNNLIKEMINLNGSAICEVDINKEQPIIPRITYDVKPDGVWTAKPLEDMHPFIDREELKKEMLIKLVEED